MKGLSFAKASTKSNNDLLYMQPANKHMLYKVNTGSCYDSVIENNLNTGLPHMVSFITDKHIQGKRQAAKEEDQDMPYEEKELNMKFKETWAEQRRIERSF